MTLPTTTPAMTTIDLDTTAIPTGSVEKEMNAPTSTAVPIEDPHQNHPTINNNPPATLDLGDKSDKKCLMIGGVSCAMIFLVCFLIPLIIFLVVYFTVIKKTADTIQSDAHHYGLDDPSDDWVSQHHFKSNYCR